MPDYEGSAQAGELEVPRARADSSSADAQCAHAIRRDSHVILSRLAESACRTARSRLEAARQIIRGQRHRRKL